MESRMSFKQQRKSVCIGISVTSARIALALLLTCLLGLPVVGFAQSLPAGNVTGQASVLQATLFGFLLPPTTYTLVQTGTLAGSILGGSVKTTRVYPFTRAHSAKDPLPRCPLTSSSPCKSFQFRIRYAHTIQPCKVVSGKTRLYSLWRMLG